MPTKYVHEILPGIYGGNGVKGPVDDIQEAHLYNHPKSAKQASAWWHYGGKVIPVQVCVTVSGAFTDEAKAHSDWAIKDIKKQFGIE